MCKIQAKEDIHIDPMEQFSQNVQKQLLKVPLTTTILGLGQALRSTHSDYTDSVWL